MEKNLINNVYCDDSISFFKNNHIKDISLVISSPTYYSRNLSRIRDKHEISGGITKQEYVKLLFNLFIEISKGLTNESVFVLVIGTYGTPVENILLMLGEEMKNLKFVFNYKLFSENNSEAIIIFSKQTIEVDIPDFSFLQEYKKVGRYGTINDEIINWAIKTFTNINDLVVDPFVGTGGSVLCAKNLNRQYLGVDLDCEAINIARKRIGKF